MGVFNYSKLHYFDKNGNELILNHYPDVRFSISNPSHPEFPADYAFVNSTPDLVDIPGNSSILPISTGMRFGLTDGTNRLDVSTYIKDTSVGQEYIGEAAIWNTPGSQKFSAHEYQSSFGVQNYPELLYNDTTDSVRDQFLKNLAIDSSVGFFPTYSFKSRMEFERVSTGLIETQTVYVLVENEFADDNHGRKRFTTLLEYIGYGNEFRIERDELQQRIDRIETYNKPESERLAELIKEYEEHGLDACDLIMQKDALDMEINSEPDLIKRRDELNRNIEKCDDVAEYIRRFRLFFFIDGRDQKDFRFFSTRYDELSWSDRSTIDFMKKFNIENSDNGYSVNIGFSGEYDGVYQQPMYVCLLDTMNTTNSEIGEAYPIGEIMLNAEAEGEDERYRTFFTNFGIPDPKEYNDIFADTDINDDLPDYISINKKSKQLFLSYNDIFPYIGSYKALLNAIKYLGYDDIFFKEWYKEIGDSAMDDSGYTTYEISYGNDGNRNTIETLDVSERIHLRKMNWVSMLYRLNQELNIPENKFGFPTVITNVENYNTERLPKLISLKNWVDRYATGVNCRVIDISGEGLVFERYNLQKWGSYQQVLEYNNEKAISPVPVTTACTLEDGEAEIKVDIYTNDHIFTIGEFDDRTFMDFCEGYFDENKVYHNYTNDLKDNENYRYFGKTFELNDSINSFQLRTKGEHSTYRFGIGSFVDNESMSLIVENDNIIFDYTDSDGKYKSTRFTNLPTIQITDGVIKRYVQNMEPEGKNEYYAYIHNTENSGTYTINVTKSNGDTNDYIVGGVPTFIPPTISANNALKPYSSKELGDLFNMNGSVNGNYGGNVTYKKGSFGLRYCIDNVNGFPCFKILGYEEKYIFDHKDELESEVNPHVPELKAGDGYEYFLEIKEGRMVFNDETNGLTVTLNFKYDENNKHQRIFVETYTYSDQSTMYKYVVGSDIEPIIRFEPNKSYDYFVNGYDTKPDDYILYDNHKSVTVNHTGSYQVAAILYDCNNNIFAKTADQKVNVLPPSADIKLYITENVSEGNRGINNPSNKGWVKNLIPNDTQCVFGYSPKLQLKERIQKDNTFRFNLVDESYGKGSELSTGIVYSLNKEDFVCANISSLSDRFIPANISGNLFTFVKKSRHDAHMTPETSSQVSNALSAIGKTKSSINSDLDYCASRTSTDITKESMFDAIICIYDDVHEKFIYPSKNLIDSLCVLIQNKAYTSSSPYDQYILKFVNGNSPYISYITNNPNYSYYFIPRWSYKISGNISYDNDKDALHVTVNMSDYVGRNFSENASLYMYYNNNDGNYYGNGLYTQAYDPDNIYLSPYYSNNEYNNDIKTFVQRYTNIWLGPSSINYDKYQCTIKTDESDISKSLIKLIDNNNMRIATKMADSQFTVSLRNFNPDDANNIWNISNTQINNMYEYVIPVITRSINGYAYAAPIVNTLYKNISDFTQSEITVRWRVYKRVGLVDRKMVMESYNKALALKVGSEKGMYDVELDVFDKQGNKYSKNMGSAFTFK